MLFYATDAGTLSAKRHMSGMSMGMFRKESCCSLEAGKDGGVVLLINEDVCRENGIKIVRTNADWTAKEETA